MCRHETIWKLLSVKISADGWTKTSSFSSQGQAALVGHRAFGQVLRSRFPCCKLGLDLGKISNLINSVLTAALGHTFHVINYIYVITFNNAMTITWIPLLPPRAPASAAAHVRTASGRTAAAASSPKASVRRGFHGTDLRVPLQSTGSRGTGRFWGKPRCWSEDFGTGVSTLSSLSPVACLAANGRALMISWAWFIQRLTPVDLLCWKNNWWRIISAAKTRYKGSHQVELPACFVSSDFESGFGTERFRERGTLISFCFASMLLSSVSSPLSR